MEAGRRVYKYVRMKNESLWNSYTKKYKLKFENFVIVAVSEGSSNKFVTIKKIEQAGLQKE